MPIETIKLIAIILNLAIVGYFMYRIGRNKEEQFILRTINELAHIVYENTDYGEHDLGYADALHDILTKIGEKNKWNV